MISYWEVIEAVYFSAIVPLFYEAMLISKQVAFAIKSIRSKRKLIVCRKIISEVKIIRTIGNSVILNKNIFFPIPHQNNLL